MHIHIFCSNDIYSIGLESSLKRENLSCSTHTGISLTAVLAQVNLESIESLLIVDCDSVKDQIQLLSEAFESKAAKLVILVKSEAMYLLSRLNFSNLRAVLPLEDLREILIGVKQAIRNRVYIHPKFLAAIWSGVQETNEHRPSLLFNDKEIKILELIFLEYSAKQIADKLYMSTRTVEWYKGQMLSKTDSKNVIGLVRYGLKEGLIRLEPKGQLLDSPLKMTYSKSYSQ